MRILVIEDERTLAGFIEQSLRAEGHAVTGLPRRRERRGTPDQVLSREQILNAVWGFDFDPGTKVLQVYIGYLRRKLGDREGPDPIETMRNVGYRLRVPRD